MRADSVRDHVALRSPEGVQAAAIVLLGLSNLAVNTRLADRAHVPWNLAVAGGLVALAHRGGHDAEDIGLGRGALSAGVRAGGMGAVAVTLAHGGLAASRWGRAALTDERITALSASEAAWQAGVRIPVGTVLLEEVAFRGVLPALLTASSGWPRHADAVSAGLFGLWHVLPSRQLHRHNAGVQRMVGRSGSAGSITAAVVTTAGCGMLLQQLRDRSGHLAAPAMVHLAANLLGFAAARLRGGMAPDDRG